MKDFRYLFNSISPFSKKNVYGGEVLRYGLISLLIWTPLAFGAVHTWAYALLQIHICLLVALRLMQYLVALRQGRETAIGSPGFVGTPLALPLILFLFLLFLQQWPAPATFIASLSPTTAELYQQFLPGWPERSTGLSLAPYATKMALGQFLAYAGLFWLCVNTLRSRHLIRSVCWAIVGTACAIGRDRYFTRVVRYEFDLLVPRYELRCGTVFWSLYQPEPLCRLPSDGDYPGLRLAPDPTRAHSACRAIAVAPPPVALVWALITRSVALDVCLVFDDWRDDHGGLAWRRPQSGGGLTMLDALAPSALFAIASPHGSGPRSRVDGGDGTLAWHHAALEAF